MKPETQTAKPAPASSLAPAGGAGRAGDLQSPPGKLKALIGATATHPNAPGRIGTIRSMTDGYAWLEYTTENEAGQPPTISLGHYKLTELTIV